MCLGVCSKGDGAGHCVKAMRRYARRQQASELRGRALAITGEEGRWKRGLCAPKRAGQCDAPL